MPSAYDRSDFTPPRDRGSVLAFGLALIAHALLIAALTWGINWQKTDVSGGYEAEIWSAVPQQAAPKLVEPPPPPEPAQPPVQPPPPAPAKEPETQAPPAPTEVDIAEKEEKKRKLLAQQKEAEEEKRAEKQKALAAAKKEKELKAREDEAKRLAAAEAQKLEAQKQAKQQAKQRETEKQSQAAVQKQRQEALDRMMGMAGSSGNSASTGNATRSTGPSASYGGRVRARVKPNIVFTDEIVGNPTAEVEVRTTPDGTIISQRLRKSSGNAAWDEAVVKAIIRTGSMPRDVDGTVPSPMILEFKPRDF